MKRLDAISRTMTLLISLSAVYALLDMNILLLAPVLTIVLPYRFMREEGEENYPNNRKVLNNLILFNLLMFVGVTAITDKISMPIFDIMTNIAMIAIYYAVLSSQEKKREELQRNPEKLYAKMNKQINTLEMMYQQTEKNIENAKNEKSKNSMEAKRDAIKFKLDETKRQADLIQKKIESKKNHNMN